MSYDEEGVPFAVVDNGSLHMKFGVGGEEYPREVIPTQGRVEQGIIKDFDGMEEMWSAMFTSLRLNPTETPLLMTQSPVNPRAHIEKTAQIAFETFQVPSFQIMDKPTLSMYASGNTEGVVLYSGDGMTVTTPIYQGYSITHATNTHSLAGRDLTDALKESCGYSGDTRYDAHFREQKKRVVVSCPTDLQECYDLQYEEGHEVELPDGQTVSIDGWTRRSVAEIMFVPAMRAAEDDSVCALLTNTVGKAGTPLLKQMYGNVVLAGGNTSTPGFADRVVSELRNMAPASLVVKVTPSSDAHYAAWVGGSILASLSSNRPNLMTKDEYDEYGPCYASMKFE